MVLEELLTARAKAKKELKALGQGEKGGENEGGVLRVFSPTDAPNSYSILFGDRLGFAACA